MAIIPDGRRPGEYSIFFTRNGIEFRANMISTIFTEEDSDVAVQEFVDYLDGWADEGTVVCTKLWSEAYVITTTEE